MGLVLQPPMATSMAVMMMAMVMHPSYACESML